MYTPIRSLIYAACMNFVWCAAIYSQPFASYSNAEQHIAVETTHNMNELEPYKPVTVVLTVGEKFSLLFSENATTGYSWSLVSPYDPRVIEPINIAHYAQTTTVNSRLVGAPQEKMERFEAVAPGTTQLNYAYFRSWEGFTNNPVYQINVIVHDNGESNF